MLRSRPEQLKLGIGGARCIDEQLATKRKGIELVRNAQAFKLERGVNGHENMVALGPQRSRGGLGQIRIGLQGFVKYLHLPPFFVGRGDDVIVAIQVTANQMQDPRAVVLVFKDLADHKDFFRISLEPAAHTSLLWEIQFIYSNKTLFLLVLFTQGDQPVVLECGNEMPALAGDEIEVLL